MTQPTPIEKKRALGNPGKRALPDITETHALEPLIDAPLMLGEHGTALWEKMTAASPWLAESDRPLMIMLCQKEDRRMEMIQQLAGEPLVLASPRTGTAYGNPLVGMLSTLETDMVKILSALAMTPSDRTRLGLAEVKAKSTLEKLRSQREKRG
jgi:P27 family predicted phage terminase small subunit